MSWSEGDFLERLMPQLRRQRGGSNSACPDAATMLAVIEGQADDWLRHAYAQHLAQCSTCSELDSRLRSFDRPVLADEPEWRQTEKRLDNWLNAFLDSRAAAAAAHSVEKPAAQVGFWQFIWRPGAVWKVALATALLAVVAVGVDVYLRLQPRLPAERAKVATAPVPAEEPRAVPTTAEGRPPRIEPPQNTQLLPGPPAAPANADGYQRGPMTAAAPKTSPPVKPQAKSEETATAAIKPPRPEPQQQAALKPPPAQPVHEPEPQAKFPTPRARTSGPAIANVAAGRVSAPQAPPGAAELPASLHLAAGARLWLSLESFNFQADGRVVFHGSLLLPLNSTGSSALDHGTEVSGFVTSAQGQTSVLLSEIVIRGSHYKLKSQGGVGNVRAAGSGGVVQFDSGKVLEMWVSSDSAYERQTAESQ